MQHRQVGILTQAPSTANVDKANVGDLVVWNNELYICKVETIGSAVFEKQVNQNELNQKQNIADNNFKGVFTSLLALQTALLTGVAGNFAQVDSGAGNPTKGYNWDVQDGWVESGGSGAVQSVNGQTGAVNLTIPPPLVNVDDEGKRLTAFSAGYPTIEWNWGQNNIKVPGSQPGNQVKVIDFNSAELIGQKIFNDFGDITTIPVINLRWSLRQNSISGEDSYLAIPNIIKAEPDLNTNNYIFFADASGLKIKSPSGVVTTIAPA